MLHGYPEFCRSNGNSVSARRGKRYRFVRVNEKNDERFLIPRVVSAGSAERSGSSEVALATRRRKKKEGRPLSEQLS